MLLQMYWGDTINTYFEKGIKRVDVLKVVTNTHVLMTNNTVVRL